jgi:hypothetical protein
MHYFRLVHGKVRSGPRQLQGPVGRAQGLAVPPRVSPVRGHGALLLSVVELPVCAAACPANVGLPHTKAGAQFTNFQELFLTRILNAILNLIGIDS